MDIEKESLNDFDAVDVPRADNQIGQQLPSNAELSRNPNINSIEPPQEQYLQVVEKQQTVFGNQADFQKILSQLTKKNKKQSELEPHIKKKPSQKKEDPLKLIKPEQTKKQKLLKIIDPHVKNYKSLNNPNVSDSQVAKLRAETRQKTFRFLMYGIEELKTLNPEQLSTEQARISKLSSKDPYILAKTLTTEIDIEFLKNVNLDNKQIASKKYKSFIKNFADNIGQETNLQLRRKILARTLPAKKLALLQEQDFYPSHIREKILQRQNLLLREAAIQEKPLVTEQQAEVEYQSRNQQIKEEKKQDEKPKYKYLDESSIIMIRDLLKPDQIIRMKKIIETDLRKDINDRLTAHFDKVFQSIL